MQKLDRFRTGSNHIFPLLTGVDKNNDDISHKISNEIVQFVKGGRPVETDEIIVEYTVDLGKCLPQKKSFRRPNGASTKVHEALMEERMKIKNGANLPRIARPNV
ncbi:hypothetical protein QTI27_35775 [Variovorax sp. J31P216]|nr:hypothetical protein [Variovorax sp. J31P216]